MKVLGINDEVTTCECCGRINLKKTVILGTDAGEVRYGTECAARALATDKKHVEKMIRKAQEEEAKARQRKANEEWDDYQAWLLATYGDTRSNLERRRDYRKAVAA